MPRLIKKYSPRNRRLFITRRLNNNMYLAYFYYYVYTKRNKDFIFDIVVGLLFALRGE